MTEITDKMVDAVQKSMWTGEVEYVDLENAGLTKEPFVMNCYDATSVIAIALRHGIRDLTIEDIIKVINDDYVVNTICEMAEDLIASAILDIKIKQAT